MRLPLEAGCAEHKSDSWGALIGAVAVQGGDEGRQGGHALILGARALMRVVILGAR